LTRKTRAQLCLILNINIINKHFKMAYLSHKSRKAIMTERSKEGGTKQKIEKEREREGAHWAKCNFMCNLKFVVSKGPFTLALYSSNITYHIA
jgi:hypothetical protein